MDGLSWESDISATKVRRDLANPPDVFPFFFDDPSDGFPVLGLCQKDLPFLSISMANFRISSPAHDVRMNGFFSGPLTVLTNRNDHEIVIFFELCHKPWMLHSANAYRLPGLLIFIEALAWWFVVTGP